MKYTPLPIPCDLGVTTLQGAMGATHPPIYLYVHPVQALRAREVVAVAKDQSWRQVPEVVPDDTLGVNEWYLVTSIGSNPP